MDNFLEYNSWFNTEFFFKSTDRFPTFRTALNLLYQNTSNPIIVETGTVRQVDDYGAGYSTYIFGKYLHKLGAGRLITIDISQDNMNISKEVTKEFEDKINYVVADSLQALTQIQEQVDLLYLDSLDTPFEPGANASPAQEHALKEFKIIEPKLHDKSIVLLDDNGLENGGKTALVKQYLKEKGWRVLFNGQQSLWIR